MNLFSIIDWTIGFLVGCTLLFVGLWLLVRLLADARRKPPTVNQRIMPVLEDLQLRADVLLPVEKWYEDALPQSPPMRIDPFRRFPPHARITIFVVFPGEYRIGWEYEGRTALPGTPRYFEFWEAAEYASNWFAESFPDAARKAD